MRPARAILLTTTLIGVVALAAASFAGVGPDVLIDQTDSPAGNGVPDQDFETSFDAYDSLAADDFVVPFGRVWSLSRVETVGTTGTPGAATIDVTVYANAVGGGDPDLPGAPVCTYADVIPGDTSGSFVIDLPTTCTLDAGTYWLGLQTNQSFGANGQHFWSNRTAQSGSESVWMNAGNGFATGCTTLTPATICGVGGGASPDLLFKLLGADDPTTTTSTSTSTTTSTSSTLPPNDCSVVTNPSFRGIECRISELSSAFGGSTPAGKAHDSGMKALGKVEAKRAQAQTLCADANAKKAGKALKKAGRKMNKLLKLVRSPALDMLPEPERNDISNRALAVQTQLQQRREALACPEDASGL